MKKQQKHTLNKYHQLYQYILLNFGDTPSKKQLDTLLEICSTPEAPTVHLLKTCPSCNNKLSFEEILNQDCAKCEADFDQTPKEYQISYHNYQEAKDGTQNIQADNAPEARAKFNSEYPTLLITQITAA